LHSAADDPSFSEVKVEVIPGTVKSLGNKDTLITRVTMKDKLNARGDLEFKEALDNRPENDGFIISVKNDYDFPIYFAVLDIQPDNIVRVAIPDQDDVYSNAEQYKVLPGKKFETRTVKLYPPYGKEFMKILITRDPLDLKGIQTRSSSRGKGSSFESFYNETFKDENSTASRGTQLSPVKIDEIRIIPLTFDIVKSKQ